MPEVTSAQEAGTEIEVELTVNGTERRMRVEARKTLCDALRDDLRLTGTHVGCEHGVCGACTVLVDGEAVRSCLMFAVQAEGTDIVTIEGLADAEGGLSPVQRAFRENHGLQCGFCTPGFIMSMTAYPERQSRPLRGGAPGRAVRQPVPVHRLPGDHQGGPHRDRGRAADRRRRAVGHGRAVG